MALLDGLGQRPAGLFRGGVLETLCKVRNRRGRIRPCVVLDDRRRAAAREGGLVAVEGAEANLAAELPGWDFEATAAAADKAWNDELSKVKIATEDETAKRIFYTALYHTMVAPSVFCDVNGDYRGSDYEIHRAPPGFTNYTTFSLWDTYRAAMPLMTILHPERMAGIVRAKPGSRRPCRYGTCGATRPTAWWATRGFLLWRTPS